MYTFWLKKKKKSKYAQMFIPFSEEKLPHLKKNKSESYLMKPQWGRELEQLK